MHPLSQDNPAAKGWDVIQDKILTHDEVMIGDFADDIDTLLVFVSVATNSVITQLTRGRPVSRRDSSLPCLLLSWQFRFPCYSPIKRKRLSSCSP